MEVDETFIGGKARKMHKSVLRERVKKFATPHTGRNQNIGKVAVMGLLERNGEVRTMVVRNVKRKSLREELNTHVEPGTMVYTDALRSYNDLNYDQQIVRCPKLVYDEVTEGNDRLAQWFRERQDRGLCVEPTQKVWDCLTEINDFVLRKWRDRRARSFFVWC